ncbi:MAG: DUF2330 domain-containing protein [Planctomycetota bacterium]|jgi:hypothetical protein
MFEDGEETLVLQSQYKTVEVEDANSIVWVVPVPSVPELATIDADKAKLTFFFLGLGSRPTIVPVIEITIVIGLSLLICLVIEKSLNRYFTKRSMTGATRLAVSVLCIGIMLVVLFILALIFLTPSLGVKGIDVLKSETVGIYNVKVIKGDDAITVTEWLKDNGFGFGEKDSIVFEQYVKKDWCFVTAKIDKDVSLNSREVISEGLAAPLILRFDSKEAVYPMALTGTTEHETEVLLYVFSDYKMECGDKLKLKYSGERRNPFGGEAFPTLKPDGFFDNIESKPLNMCKFKGTLMPNQMTEDIVFKKAKDNKPYREIKWHWMDRY